MVVEIPQLRRKHQALPARELIQLSEHKEWEGILDDEDAEYIRGNFVKKFACRREIRGGRPVDIINPKQWVGILTLPSGRRVESHSKVPVRNLFYMLAVAFELNFKNIDFWDELAGYERYEGILEFLATYFVDLVTAKSSRGLYHAYVEREDNLRVLRGRINFTEDVRHNFALRDQVYCQYTEFSSDIPENQIIRQTVYLLSRWEFNHQLKQQLNHLDVALAQVRPTNHPATIIDTFSYHRQSTDYQILHQFCRLFLEASSLREAAGALQFPSFLLDVNKLFEKFVTQLLISNAPRGVTVTPQFHQPFDDAATTNVVPDITLSINNRPTVVADCKYKAVGADEHKSPDLYQLLAYCTSMQVEQGVLIYPRWERSRNLSLQVKNTSIRIEHRTIDLGLEGEAFKRECAEFSEELLYACAKPKLSELFADTVNSAAYKPSVAPSSPTGIHLVEPVRTIEGPLGDEPVEPIADIGESTARDLQDALTLIAKGQELVQEALEIYEDDWMTADNCMMRLQMVLAELFAIRSLDDGFRLVVSSMLNGLLNLNGEPMNQEQIASVGDVLRHVEAEPSMTFERGVDITELLGNVGMDVEVAEAEYLAGMEDE